MGFVLDKDFWRLEAEEDTEETGVLEGLETEGLGATGEVPQIGISR